MLSFWLVVWHSSSVVCCMNGVTLRWAQLVLGCVIVFGRVYHIGMLPSQLGQLSFASVKYRVADPTWHMSFCSNSNDDCDLLGWVFKSGLSMKLCQWRWRCHTWSRRQHDRWDVAAADRQRDASELYGQWQKSDRINVRLAKRLLDHASNSTSCSSLYTSSRYFFSNASLTTFNGVFTLLTWSDLIIHLNWVHCDWLQPWQTVSFHSLLCLMQSITEHSVQMKQSQMRWDQIRQVRWDEMRDVNSP